MPSVSLPKTWKGWIVTLASSFVGFFAGTIALDWLSKHWK
jgi:hypothetical protein